MKNQVKLSSIQYHFSAGRIGKTLREIPLQNSCINGKGVHNKHKM